MMAVKLLGSTGGEGIRLLGFVPVKKGGNIKHKIKGYWTPSTVPFFLENRGWKRQESEKEKVE
jgi:hypothetical protein